MGAGTYFLGYDLGSSFVKASLLDADRGAIVASASYPSDEMPIDSPSLGWAEQHPEQWWDALVAVTRLLMGRADIGANAISGIGIAYQMHGLVLVDDAGDVLRPAILWCDSRAVPIGARAFAQLGEERCLDALLNSPGNFTASKLAWVREHEPHVFQRAAKFMLPGDYAAFRLTGAIVTTLSGLSEGMLWDFSKHAVADFLMDYYGLPRHLLPGRVPTFGEQGRLTEQAAKQLGLRAGTPVTYRAGDQPNNALSLGVAAPGELAATAGTSGVIYGVGEVARADPLSRVNTFAHVNHRPDHPRLGMLLCLNGAGSAYRWLRGLLRTDYEDMNREALEAPAGADGLRFFPFGNGAERVLENRGVGAFMQGIDFNRHDISHVVRAVSEGVAFAFRYGIEILGELGVSPSVVRAGATNMFQSRMFTQTLATLGGVRIELYRTGGADGAARGAAIGAGFYASVEEASEHVSRLEVVEPGSSRSQAGLEQAYGAWSEALRAALMNGE